MKASKNWYSSNRISKTEDVDYGGVGWTHFSKDDSPLFVIKVFKGEFEERRVFRVELTEDELRKLISDGQDILKSYGKKNENH